MAHLLASPESNYDHLQSLGPKDPKHATRAYECDQHLPISGSHCRRCRFQVPRWRLLACHAFAGSEVRAHVEGPLARLRMEPPASDDQRLDDEPRIPVSEEPRLGVEMFPNERRVGIDVVESPAHKD